MPKDTPHNANSEIPGNEVITVEVRLNNVKIARRCCTLVERVGQSQNYRYKTDDNNDIVVFQRRNRPLLELADILLQRI